MPFVKVVKSKAYYKRFQVKYRRRREGKTDYRARRKLTIQAKNKYASPKYRFVFRKSNKKILCQIIYATILGDKVLCESNSNELKQYGLTAGLTNYPAAYATGLLCGRRLLTDLGMDKLYKGEEAKGTYTNPAKLLEGDRRPFKCYLDLGLSRATTGNRAFGAMKGAKDAGLCIPHSDKRFPGYSKKGAKKQFNADVHREHIFGLHVEQYMDKIEESDPEKYKLQFGYWQKCLDENGLDSLEELYKKVHAAIRKNPKRAAKEREFEPVRHFQDIKKSLVKTHKSVYFVSRKLTREERKARAQEKVTQALEQLKA